MRLLLGIKYEENKGLVGILEDKSFVNLGIPEPDFMKIKTSDLNKALSEFKTMAKLHETYIIQSYPRIDKNLIIISYNKYPLK